MGLKTCFTDHSLFGFADAASILTNKLLKFTLSDVDSVICVSHTCKENTVLRAALDPSMVSVIPNAVVAENFRPDPTAATPNHVTIVVISRLFYNKGTDLLVAAIPRICEIHPSVRFIVAGSGPKAIDLEQMLEKHMLQDRVEMLGPIRHEEVRDVGCPILSPLSLGITSRSGSTGLIYTTIYIYRSWSEATSTSTPPSLKLSAPSSSKPPPVAYMSSAPASAGSPKSSPPT